MACSDIKCIIDKLKTQVITPLISLLFVVAMLVFVWGLIMYVVGSSGDKTKLEQGKRLMLWGIIGLFIMSSAWAIVSILCNFFGVSCTTY